MALALSLSAGAFLDQLLLLLRVLFDERLRAEQEPL
jgi:hypothetical protein